MTRVIRLYRKKPSDLENPPTLSFSDYGYSVLIFKPGFFRFGIDKTERIKKIIWYLITRGRYKILYVMEGQRVVHYSFIIPKNYRFPFMGPDDLEIGPCFTDANYRGKGIYSRVLKMIPQMFNESARAFWIYTLQSNTISQRAIEKTGYSFSGLMRNSKLFKILKHVEINE